MALYSRDSLSCRNYILSIYFYLTTKFDFWRGSFICHEIKFSQPKVHLIYGHDCFVVYLFISFAIVFILFSAWKGSCQIFQKTGQCHPCQTLSGRPSNQISSIADGQQEGWLDLRAEARLLSQLEEGELVLVGRKPVAPRVFDQLLGAVGLLSLQNRSQQRHRQPQLPDQARSKEMQNVDLDLSRKLGNPQTSLFSCSFFLAESLHLGSFLFPRRSLPSLSRLSFSPPRFIHLPLLTLTLFPCIMIPASVRPSGLFLNQPISSSMEEVDPALVAVRLLAEKRTLHPHDQDNV